MKSVKPRVRAIARKLIEMAEGGDLQAIKEVGDRLDGKCAQTIERGDLSVEMVSNCELFVIIRGGPREPLDVLADAGPISGAVIRDRAKAECLRIK